ncbi:hypothetical protein L9F63_017380, partial [Diploptera punctata]
CDSGFGNLLAQQLDAKGVTVFAGCLFADGSDALKLKENCSNNLHILQLDVTKDEHVKNAVKYVTNNLGDKKLWAVVNNAGIGVGTDIPSSASTDERQSGYVASLAGRLLSVFMGSYCMSKFATVAYADILRMEMMRFGISVHTIEPWIF